MVEVGTGSIQSNLKPVATGCNIKPVPVFSDPKTGFNTTGFIPQNPVLIKLVELVNHINTNLGFLFEYELFYSNYIESLFE